jgi:Ca2+/Na+ antiporter
LQKLKFSNFLKKENNIDKYEEIQEIDRPRFSLEHILLSNNQTNRNNAILLLFVSLVIMTIGTWLLVLGTEFLGRDKFELFGKMYKGLNIPLIYVSVLLASAASSIPDTMISIRDTKKGNYADAISNAFGSNTFDISFALGLPLLAYTLIYQPIAMDDDTRAWSMAMWLAMLAINIIVFLIMIIGRKIGKLKAVFLIVLYILFVFFVLEEAVGNSVIAELARYLIK